MSADDYRQLFHLTPKGWAEGMSTSYAKIDAAQAESDRPADALETWEEHLTQSSIYSPTHSSKKLLWRHPEHSQEECDAIAAQFKEPFHGDAPGPLDGYRRERRSGTAKPKPDTPPRLRFDGE
jgi:hypothetical protein